jgi:hypothetical protein
MADHSRTPRDTTSREKSLRGGYTPPTALPDPDPDPGYAYRWIATHVLGQHEVTNVSKKMREGWEPVKASDHPELMIEGDSKGNVEIGGLMLCKMPVERAKARDEFYQKQAQSQMESVDNNFMRQNDSRMPLFKQRQSETKFGRGSNL